VEDGTAVQVSMALAETLAQRSAHAFGVAKQLLTDSFDTSFETRLERERQVLSACAAHPNGQEDLKAFAEAQASITASPPQAGSRSGYRARVP
jgi:enoyl-CoA hydratase/carnithine racemase